MRAGVNQAASHSLVGHGVVIKALPKDEFIKHRSAVSRRCDAARSKMREKRKLRKQAEKIESQHWDAVMKNRRRDPTLFRDH